MRRGMLATLAAITMCGACTQAPPATATPPANAPAATPATSAAPVGMDAKSQRAVRDALLAQLTPVTLSNCTFTRVGSSNDGGYVMCGNLMSGGKSVYSYGIGGHDAWGCSVSKMLKAPAHQYDCFEPPNLTCPGGRFVPHNECVGAKAETVDNRVFDTITSQIARNGDTGKQLIVKMDVEGAEWRALLETEDAVLERFDQLAMELHGTSEPHYLDVIQKLKKTFHLVHLHFNNWSCTPGFPPFPAGAYQVLFVNKRLGVVGPPPPGQPRARDFDAPDNPSGPDCQLPATAS
jgi:hypothetical protein